MQIGRSVSPLLICLNLQRTYTDPRDACYAPRGAEALVNAGACLAWARRREMPVWHVHTRSIGARAAPIPGFEPHPSERLLMKQSWSLFDSAEVADARPPLERAFVVGFSAAKDCLATAIDAERTGVRLVFITDAIASPPLSNQPIEVFEDVLASLLSDWALGVTTADLLRHQIGLSRLRRPSLNPDPAKPGAASAQTLRLLKLIALCKEATEAIATNDHATMDELERALATAEAATHRLLSDLVAGDAVSGIVDLDDF